MPAAFSFRPRALPVIATGMALSMVAVFTVIWIRLPPESRASFTLFQRLTLLFFGGVILWLLYRMATVRIVAYDDELAIRNVFRSYHLPWSRIRALRFSSGDAWLQLFDNDGNRLGVLAIQTADGARAAHAARDLAAVARRRINPAAG
jgi:small-conductance mechanosensitive channel